MPMENDANTGWFKEGQNFDEGKGPLQKSGYDGRADRAAAGHQHSLS